MKSPAIFKNKLLINIFFITVIFAASVIVRVNNLKAPMGRHHEWLTGHVLTTLSIYEKNGIGQHYYSPVWRFNNPTDLKMISNQAFKDKNGYNYYVSYPPFCFILPYISFKLTFTEVSVTALRVFGLINHLLCALLVFFIINRLFKKKLGEDVFLPSLIAYTLYLFASGNLWFHANVYFADMLVHLFVLSALYVFISVIEEPREKKRSKLILLSVFTFLGVYTEWIALFIAFFMGLFLFLKVFRNRVYFNYILALAIFAILSLGLSIWQYSQIAGFELLKEQSVNKYKSRSGYDKNAADGGFTIDRPISKTRVSMHYENNYEQILDYAWLCLYLVIALFIFNRFDKRTKIPQSHIMAFCALLFSILTHHFIFFNFTVVHDFSTLKSSMFLVLFIGYMIGQFTEYIDSIKTKRFFSVAFVLITAWFVHLSLQKYYKINRLDPVSYCEMAIGDVVKKHSKPDEVIFTDIFVTPVLYYYTQRNVIQVDNMNGCFWYLNEGSCEKGFYIRVKKTDKDFSFEGIRVNNKGDSLKVF